MKRRIVVLDPACFSFFSFAFGNFSGAWLVCWPSTACSGGGELPAWFCCSVFWVLAGACPRHGAAARADLSCNSLFKTMMMNKTQTRPRRASSQRPSRPKPKGNNGQPAMAR